jgi:hypothetical protein
MDIRETFGQDLVRGHETRAQQERGRKTRAQLERGWATRARPEATLIDLLAEAVTADETRLFRIFRSATARR